MRLKGSLCVILSQQSYFWGKFFSEKCVSSLCTENMNLENKKKVAGHLRGVWFYATEECIIPITTKNYVLIAIKIEPKTKFRKIPNNIYLVTFRLYRIYYVSLQNFACNAIHFKHNLSRYYFKMPHMSKNLMITEFVSLLMAQLCVDWLERQLNSQCFEPENSHNLKILFSYSVVYELKPG